jgi:hypothetical protein
MVVNVGEQVSLTCVTDGHPKPVTTWVKDGIRVTNGNRFVVQSTGELSIKEIGKTDEGNYECVAKNDVGSVVKTVRVVVRGKTILPQRITRAKISQLVNRMCSHCFFPVVNKSGTSCYHLVTRLMMPTDSQQVVQTSPVSSARNNLMKTIS